GGSVPGSSQPPPPARPPRRAAESETPGSSARYARNVARPRLQARVGGLRLWLTTVPVLPSIFRIDSRAPEFPTHLRQWSRRPARTNRRSSCPVERVDTQK